MKRLIINADDFGLAPGVNRAVMELEQAGALRSTTLMATAQYFSQAVHLAFAQPRLAVGCHVVLIDGSPCLRAGQVSSLLHTHNSYGSAGSHGRFRPTVAAFVSDLLRGRIRAHEIEVEAVAQIRRVQSSGITVSHIDTHKHLHMFPQVLAPLLRAARQCRVGAVRNPFEPMWSLRATRGGGVVRRAEVYALRTYRRKFLSLVREHGLETTDGAVGVLATGSLDAQALRNLLQAMPEGTWELVCHPAYVDEALQQAHTRLLGTREVEREALLAVIPGILHTQKELALIDFHDLAQLSEYR